MPGSGKVLSVVFDGVLRVGKTMSMLVLVAVQPPCVRRFAEPGRGQFPAMMSFTNEMDRYVNEVSCERNETEPRDEVRRGCRCPPRPGMSEVKTRHALFLLRRQTVDGNRQPVKLAPEPEDLVVH